jgi:hypothetical protein
MVWDKIKKAGSLGLEQVQGIGDALNRAAKGAVETAALVKSGSLSVMGNAQNAISNAGTYALQSIEGGYVRITSGVQDSLADLDDGLNSARNSIARNLKETANSVSDGAGAAAELGVMGTLIVATGGAGIFVYPFVAGETDKLVKRAATGVTDPLYKAIRSKRTEFLDTFDIKGDWLDSIFDGRAQDVMAMIYMPGHDHADADGIALFTEEALFQLTRSPQPAHEASVFQLASDKVVARKKELGLEPLQGVLIRESIAIAQARKNGLEL